MAAHARSYVPKHYLTARGGSCDAREVRRLLRGLRRPHVLENEPLVQFLCETYNANLHDALQALLKQTFSAKGSVGIRLMQLIQRCDIDASLSQAETASRMSISARQFFRYRREAVDALAAQINHLIAAMPLATTAISELAKLIADSDPYAGSRLYESIEREGQSDALARIDALLSSGRPIDQQMLVACSGTTRLPALLVIARALIDRGRRSSGRDLIDLVKREISPMSSPEKEAITFHILMTEYTDAMMHGDTEQTSQLALQMRRAASADQLQVFKAFGMQVDTAFRAGDPDLAQETLAIAGRLPLPRQSIRWLGFAVSCEAVIAFLRNDLDRADYYILAAQLALKNRPLDAMIKHALGGRIRLAQGLPWSAPPELLVDPQPNQSTKIQPSSDSKEIELPNSYRDAFASLYLRVVDARARILTDSQTAQSELQALAAISRKLDYPNLTAQSLAGLAALSALADDPQSAQHLHVEAWRELLRTRDFLAGHDLFMTALLPAHEFGAVAIDGEFLDVLCGSLTSRFPGSFFSKLCGHDAQRAYWRAVILDANNLPPTDLPDLQRRFIEAIYQLDSGGTTLQHYRTAIIREVSMNLAIFTPPPARRYFLINLRRSLRRFFETLRDYDIKMR